MTKKPPFPNPGFTEEYEVILRDYFAAHSIHTAMNMVKQDFDKDEQDYYWHSDEFEIVASRAYTLADAMMEARKA